MVGHQKNLLMLEGYTDIEANIDLSTFRRIPWEDNIPFFLVTSPLLIADWRFFLQRTKRTNLVVS